MRNLWTRILALGAVAAMLGVGGVAVAQTPPAAPAAPAAAPAPEPKPSDTNAERAKSQPGNNAPFWRSVRDSGAQAGNTSLPGPEMGQLIQRFVQYPGSQFTTAGEAWRQVRNRWIIPYGGSLMFIAVLALAIFYWRRGVMGGDHSGAAPAIERFTPFERAAHWTNAIAFVVLAVSGIVMAFGKFFLLPVLGSTLFGWMSYALKTVHNFVGPLFAVSLVIVLVTFVRDNIVSKADITWLKKGGGMMGGADHEVPSHRFNAGEKGVYWLGAFIPGLLVVFSGLWLDQIVPGLPVLRGDMQVAHMIHAAAACIMMAVIIGHIYMGTVGVRGAYRAMRTGWVSESWAKEHHDLWYQDIKAGKIPARRSRPAGEAAPIATPPAQQA